MENIFTRTENLIGADAVNKLNRSHIALFGLGGVGGTAFEALVRAGVLKISVFDADVFSPSNLNRQLLATQSTLGKAKVQAAKEHAASINPNAEIICHNTFYSEENSSQFDLSQYDYIIDAIDSVSSKIELITKAADAGVPIISCMGTGNKLDPTAFEVSDLFKTSVCPLCRVMRRELSKKGITALKVVYSKEVPRSPLCEDKRTPASISFVPTAAGLVLSGEVIRSICNLK